jgi:hypothetical protein
MKSEQQNKIFGIQKKIYGFLLQSPYNSFYSSQNYVSKNPLLKILPFRQSQVTSSWFQKQQKFQIQTNNVPWLIPI